MLDPKNRREKGMQKWFCQLAWIHWIHAGLVFQLMGTGAFLYLPQLRTAFVEWHMGIRTWHLAAALLYAIVLAVSSPRIVAYAKRIPRRIAKRIHLMLVYAAGLIWLVSGAIMWRIHDFPAAWRGPAISLHDGLTWAAIPWISLHVAWFLLRRRYGSVIRRIGVVLRRHQTTPADLWRLSRDKTDISRRQAIIGLATVFLALSGGILTKRYWPYLQPQESAEPKKKGRFRLYNVAPEPPRIQPEEYRLRIDGLVASPLEYSLADLNSLPHLSMTRDFHCVTGWSVTNVEWAGIPLSYLLQQVKLLPNARYMTVYSLDGLYTDSYGSDQFTAVDVLLALRMDGQALPAVHGGPCRIVFPALYGYKSVKWVGRIEFTGERAIGYWEQRGYDLNGYLPS